jgi:hypothetical protein
MKALLAMLALTAAAPPHPAATHATAHSDTPMIAQTGSARHTATTHSGSGIAGSDLARPTLRSTAGGATGASSGISGGVVHRHP